MKLLPKAILDELSKKDDLIKAILEDRALKVEEAYGKVIKEGCKFIKEKK